MSDKIEHKTLREQSEKLFRRRLFFALHILAFIGVMLLTRGRLVRVLPLLEIWVLLLLAHTVYLALYETREGTIRKEHDNRIAREREERAASRAAEEASREFAPEEVHMERPVEKAKHDGDDGYFTIGSDGELIPLSESEADNETFTQG